MEPRICAVSIITLVKFVRLLKKSLFCWVTTHMTFMGWYLHIRGLGNLTSNVYCDIICLLLIVICLIMI